MSEQAPKYLQNETTLKQEVSYSTREQIIRANRDFQMRNYTGTTEENEHLLTLLRSNPELRDFFEKKAGIRKSTRQETVRLQEDADRNPPARKAGFFRRLFGGGNSSKGRDEVVILGKGQEAEYGKTTTLCAKTTRENAKTLFGIDIPRADAGPQAREIAKKYPQITLDNSRNESGRAQVAYVKIDVVDSNGKPISHVALATKPFGGKEWFVLDPYKGQNAWMPLSNYPERRNIVAYELQGTKDTLTTGRAVGSMKVREYKQGLLSGNERATENPSVDYGKAINSDNIFYALGDRDFSGTMGDDGRRKRFLWIIPYGKKQSTNISDEYHITTELSEIASLPKTNVNKFIAQCIEVGGGGKHTIESRQELIRLFFPDGQYNKSLHQQFLKGFDMLNRAGHIDEIKASDTLTPFTEAQKRGLKSVEFTNSHEKLVRTIQDQLLKDNVFDSGAVKKGDPLYDIIKRDSGLADRLARQTAAFLNIKGGALSASAMTSIDITKHIKVVAGMANGQPGVGVVFTGKLFEGDTGSITGSIGAWNILPIANISGEKYLNMESVRRNLQDYTQSVQVLRGSITITPAGVVVEAGWNRDKVKAIETKTQALEKLLGDMYTGKDLPPQIANELRLLYETLGNDPKKYSQAVHAVVESYRDSLVEANQGLYLKGISIGGGVLGGLPTVIAGIRFAYLRNKKIPDAKILKRHVIDLLEGRGLTQAENLKAKGLASSINERSLNIGGYAYTADTLMNNSGNQVLRIRSGLRKNPLNVFAAPGYEGSVRIYKDGTIDIIGNSKSIPSITTRNEVVGPETRRYMIVGGTRADNAVRISRTSNDLPEEYRSIKTVNGIHYFSTRTTPNISNPDEREFVIGASMQFLKTEKPQQTPQKEEPCEPGKKPPHPRPCPEPPHPRPQVTSTPSDTVSPAPADVNNATSGTPISPSGSGSPSTAPMSHTTYPAAPTASNPAIDPFK